MASFKASDDFRRQKELEEARKAGLAPAEVDEEGKEINPHIPQYMTNAPWYLNNDRPTLKHQRNWKGQAEDDKQWYDRGAKVFQATTWRKGACENCGSASHKTADCLERPRAKGARWTNKNIAADDKVQEINLPTWDSKRDRYNGYDAAEYARVVERYEALEALHKEMKAKERVEALYAQGAREEAAAAAAAAAAAGGGEDVDEAKIQDEEDAAFGEVKKRVRTTAGGSTGSVRNLRIREDTAKYLLNLDANSAYYDPKSRSMREDPNPNKPDTEKTFRGDNFIRTSGEVQAWQALNLHSMQAFDKGQEVHVLAVPSLAETMYQQYKEKKDSLGKKNTKEILERYGNAGAKPSEEALLLGQTEAYVEYDRSGRVIKGQEVKARSRYEEDVFINNHTTVWGSWWAEGVWGYGCCHSTVKNSYCTGKAGEAAAAAATQQMVANLEAKAAQKAADAEAEYQRRAASTLSNAHLEKGDLWGSEPAAAGTNGADLDPEKVKAALKKLEQRERELEEDDEAAAAAGGGGGGLAHGSGAERKRGYNSLAGENDSGVTPEEMEAYRIKKQRSDDPMAAFKRNGGAGAHGQYDLLE